MGKKSNPLKAVTDILNTTTTAIKDTVDTTGKAINDTSRQVGRLDKIILSPSNAKEEAAKDQAKQDAAQREKAMADQKELASNLRRQEATSADASGGSTILLGKKGKKSKGSKSVSAGMGLSTGKTGLQA